MFISRGLAVLGPVLFYRYLIHGGNPYLPGVEVGRQRWVVADFNLLTQHIEVHLVTIKWTLQSCHFVEQTPHGPNVRFKVVAVLVDSFRAHVVRCPYQRMCSNRLSTEEATEAQVAEFDYA